MVYLMLLVNNNSLVLITLLWLYKMQTSEEAGWSTYGDFL